MIVKIKKISLLLSIILIIFSLLLPLSYADDLSAGVSYSSVDDSLSSADDYLSSVDDSLSLADASSYTSLEDSSNIIFAWAEQQYPQYFSSHGQKTTQWDTWYYRFYPQTGIYIGINNQNNLYIMGGEFGALPKLIGSTEDFLSEINTTSGADDILNGDFAILALSSHYITSTDSQITGNYKKNFWAAAKPQANKNIVRTGFIAYGNLYPTGILSLFPSTDHSALPEPNLEELYLLGNR